MTPAAFTRDVLPLGEGLYRIAFYILEDEAQARDALQDLYLRLWLRRDVLDGVRDLKAYANTLMRNLCIDRIRSAERARTGPLETDFAQDADEEERIAQRDRLRRILAAVERLPARQRTVLRKYVLEQKSYREITEETGIPYLTLRVLLSQARRTLRKGQYEKD